jgi:arylsulfatase A-like enzyme
LLSAVLAAVGCSSDGEHTSIPVRLADRGAAAHGLREPPSVSVDATRRYAMTEVPTLVLASQRLLSAGPSGALVTTIKCDQALAGRRVLATFRAESSDGSMPLREWVTAREVACAGPGGSEVELGVADVKPGTLSIATVMGYMAPAPRVQTGWLQLGRGATLELAIGSADPRAPAQTSASRFSLEAENRSARKVTLLERTLDPATVPNDRGWVELRIDLAPALAALGTEVRLLFAADAVAPDTLTFPVWGDPTIRVGPAPASKRRRSVILVSLDTLRADRLGAYGFPRPTSPNFDRLASEGTLFEQAVAQANSTLPSHATMLTGLTPCGHRVAPKRALSPGIVPLAEILRREGYATAAFTEDGWVDPVSLGRGFGLFRANTSISGGATGLVEETFAEAREWMRIHQTEDFFVFVHTYQVHAPYDPPATYRAMPPADGQIVAPHHPAPSPSAAADAAAYAAEVRYTDAALGQLVEDIEALGLLEHAILIVTSDHGEAFGEHGVLRHGTSLFEEELHVPLLVRAPGLVAAGRRVSDLVGVVDIAPTILELLGIAIPPWAQGVSLAQQVRADASPRAGPHDRVLPAESYSGQSAIRGERWKAIFTGDRASVLLLDRDPEERHPQRPSPIEGTVQAAKAHLAADCDRVRAVIAPGGPPEHAPASAPDPDMERKLRALGYL